MEKLRRDQKSARVLLIVPASLLGNWQKETEKFAPRMTFQEAENMLANVNTPSGRIIKNDNWKEWFGVF